MESNVIVSSRIRLARDIKGMPFPHMMSNADCQKLVDKVFDALDDIGDFDYFQLGKMNLLNIQMAIESNDISKELLKNSETGAYAKSIDETVTIMVCEEDHIRLQCIMPGLSLRKAYDIANDIDSELNKSFEYAFSSKLGYLTACPTNIGTGMRASVMMFLPALTIAGSIDDIIATISKMGIVLRGSRGEGSKASEFMYQLSNEITLGKTEDEIITMVENAVLKLVDLETNARKELLEKNYDMLVDKCHRAYGILSNSYIMSTDEAQKLLSDIKLGLALGLIKIKNADSIDDICDSIKPYHIMGRYGKNIDSETRDKCRAKYLHNIFANTLIE